MPLDQFKERLLSSGLISQKSFDEFLKSYDEDQCVTAEILARDLHQAKLLTKYQLQLISQGMGQLLSFGDYVLQERIGSGGMGTVYRAIHTKMNRAVAIKILNPKLSSNPALLERFDREVRATAKLQHINIVHAYDAGEHNRAHFLVMELVEGIDLNRVIAEKGPLSVPHALECVTQVAEGLKYAHAQGIIHRDVKPSNILLSRTGVIKLSDMGLVRVTCDWDDSDIEKLDANLSRTGLVMGSVNFMAPEQAMDSRDTDERSDIYSLGATLYFLLTGKTMFSADTATKTILAMQTSSPPSIQADRADVGDEIESVYLKMVARHPEDRFRTMGHVLDAIKKCKEAKSERESEERSEIAANGISNSHIFDSDLSQDFWIEREKKSASKLSKDKQSVNVLDEDSIHEESNDATLMQMLPENPDPEFLESSILQEVTRSHRRAMLAVIIPLSLATIYFFARSLQQTAGTPPDAIHLQRASANQSGRIADLHELLPDLDEQVWTALIPDRLTSETDATFEVQGDGTIVVSGASKEPDRYTIVSSIDANRIAGVRVEVIPSPEAPGDQDNWDAAEFHLTGLVLRTHPNRSTVMPPSRFQTAYTDYYQSLRQTGEAFYVTHALDGNPDSAWAVGRQFRLPHWAIFETNPDSVSDITKAVTISLESGDTQGVAGKLRRFRVLVTDKPRPMLQELVRNGNLSEIEKRAAASLIVGNPREASDLLQSTTPERTVESGTRLVLLAIAFQEQLLIGPARKAADDLADWLRANRPGHPLLLSLAEHVLVEIGGLDHREREQILDRCKLEYQIAAWTEKLQESPFAESRYALRARGKAHARLGQWKRAAADFLKVSRGEDVEEKDHLQTLVALAACNDLEKFQELCQFLSENYSDRDLAMVPARMLCVGVLVHPEGAFYAGKFVQSIDREMPQLSEDSPLLPSLLVTRGLAYYRENKPQVVLHLVDRAIEEIESRDEQVRQKLLPIRAGALLLRSLALQKQKNSGEAAKALQEASDLIPPVWRKIIDSSQTETVIFERIEFELDWIVAAILLREAAAAQQPDLIDNDSLAL